MGRGPPGVGGFPWGLSPNDPVDVLAAEVGEAERDLTVVGHLPHLGRLVSRLVSGREDAGVVAFSPGTAVCLARDEDGGWTVVWMIPPELLRD